MDNFFDPTMAWGLYLISALIGCWCWRAMFFFMKRSSVIRDFLVMLGPVLLLTPTPLAAGRSEFAPAFMVAAFSAINGETEITESALMWWLGGLVVGIVYVLVRMVVRLQTRKPAAAEDGEHAAA